MTINEKKVDPQRALQTTIGLSSQAKTDEKEVDTVAGGDGKQRVAFKDDNKGESKEQTAKAKSAESNSDDEEKDERYFLPFIRRPAGIRLN